MFDPASVNVSALPWLPLDAKSAFPRQACIYFAIDSQGSVQYIGRTIDSQQRWRNHHRYGELDAIGDIRIAYLFMDADLLPSVEKALVKCFAPPLNRVKYQELFKRERSKINGSSSRGSRIRVVYEYDAEDLPAWLEGAIAQSDKSVSAVCRQAGISNQYWYDLLNDKKTLRLETLQRIEEALGVKYQANWRDRHQGEYEEV